MVGFLSRFVADQRGATAIEYGLIATLIAVVALGALGMLSGNVQKMFGRIQTAVLSAG